MNKKQSKNEMARVWPALAMMATIWLAGAAEGWAADSAAPAAKSAVAIPATGDETVVLGELAMWRCIQLQGNQFARGDDGSLRQTSVFWHGSGKEADPRNLPPLTYPQGWTAAAFDDGAWPRARWPQPALDGIADLAGVLTSPSFRPFDTIGLLARGKFLIQDPAQVKACVLSLKYWGGVVVYVNGKEVARGNMSNITTNGVTLAEDYPENAFVGVNDRVIRPEDFEKNRDRLALRVRELPEVQIPGALLIKGVNVVAVEVHAAPIHEKVFRNRDGNPAALWPPVGLLSAGLTVSPAAETRAGGVRVWNAAVTDRATTFDTWNPAEPLRPIMIRAARNTVFSGRLMVDSDQPIKGLTATVSDLAQAGGSAKISANSVRVRYAVPAEAAKSYVQPPYFDGLLDAIPAVIPVAASTDLARPFFGGWTASWSGMVARAVAPLWFTVRVPRNVPAGVYEGTVSVEAEGMAPTSVALRVNVCDWTAPDPKDFRMQNFLYHSEDAMASFYEVPRWSDKHFELLGKSLALGAEVNSRQVFVNLTYNFAGSNGESLIRWIKQADGSYKHDFTIFDKYLDMVDKAMGKPRPLRLNCWGAVGTRRGEKFLETHGMSEPGGVWVTGMNPTNGDLYGIAQPLPGTPESLAFWRPVFATMLPKIKARDWLDETALGHNSMYNSAMPEVVDMAYQLWPEGVWSYVSHHAKPGERFVGTQSNITMVVRHGATPFAGGIKLTRPDTFCSTYRTFANERSALTEMRRIGEDIDYRGVDGVSDFGLDIFPKKIPDPRGGVRYDFHGGGRGTDWSWRSTMSLLYPGPEGPVATERYEMFREGIELSEAIRFIRRVIEEKKLGAELQERAKRYLDDRAKAFGEGAFDLRHMQANDDAKLLDLAGEVAREVERKK